MYNDLQTLSFFFSFNLFLILLLLLYYYFHYSQYEFIHVVIQRTVFLYFQTTLRKYVHADSCWANIWKWEPTFPVCNCYYKNHGFDTYN